MLSGNEFRLIVRNCTGKSPALSNIFEQIKQRGIPNYFGEQRFGFRLDNRHEYEWNNLKCAMDWFSGAIKKPRNRNQRSLYLSAARSWIFNHILSARVKANNWDKALNGDVFMLGNSRSWFADDGDTSITSRVKDFDIHPTGALWGRGKLDSRGEMKALELAISEEWSLFSQGLEAQGLKQERRSLRIQVDNLGYQWLSETDLELEFSLPPGSYATVFLDQILSR